MLTRAFTSNHRIGNRHKITLIIGLSFLAFLLMIAGSTACKKAVEEGKEEGSIAAKKGVIEFEGNVKVVVGKYLYIPKAKGFEIVVQGALESGDTSSLVNKEIKGRGMILPERPSILIADSLEVKDESGKWSNIFTRTEDAVIGDYLDTKARDGFPVLNKLSYDKKEGWEGKGKVKVYGKLEKENDAYKIIIFNDNGKEAGKIIADNFTNFSLFYVKKLGLFDSFWFYINVKDTIDWKIRRQTHEMFHADVLFSGLF